jgi:predicted TIM-barrel fold metal-dependent hydrolase
MLSRRKFLNSTLGAGLGLTTQGSRQVTAQAPAIQPAQKASIVDAQVHLWAAETPDRPWVPGRKPQLPEPFTVEKLLPLMNEAGVDRVVLVPPSWPGDRNDYALEVSQKYPDRFGVMGRIPLEKPESAALLPKWKEQPGMLGIRLTFIGAQTTWLTDGTADWIWPAAEKAGLPIMFLTTDKMPEFAGIAERHPQLTLIIDHMGLTAEIVRNNMKASAIESTVSLAKYPNVCVKLSAVPGYSSEAYPFRDMTPYVRRVFDAFGPQRCFWGTDLTNSFTKVSYRQRITHFTEELDFLSNEDKEWIMGRSILARLRWA